ncbi:hypothetical protein [Aliikangiella maris]|uniref:DUF2157 domain-containing protein n=2 Tax=Aliikangiella maris TaxID=3162458 RepID=A0ABV3MKB2_9GAMM
MTSSISTNSQTNETSIFQDWQQSEKFAHPPEQKHQSSWLNYLPILLRSLGGFAILIALYSFVLQGWQTHGDGIRYIIFLTHTLLLAVIALLIGKYLKESKGARLLLSLSLISIPIDFVISGAFIQAFQSSTLTDANQPFTWQPQSLSLTIGLCLATFVVSTPIILFGFKVFNRHLNKQASLLFIAINSLLLIPIRDTLFITTFVFICTSSLLLYYHFLAKKQIAMKTLEGKFLLTLQFLPVLLLLGRSFWLYHMDSLLTACSCLVGFVLIRQFSFPLTEKSRQRQLLEGISLVLIFIGVLNFVIVFENYLPDALNMIFSSLIGALMLFEMSARTKLRQLHYRLLASLCLLYAGLVNYFLIGDSLAIYLTLIFGISLLTVSVLLQQRALFISGSLLTLIGMFNFLGELLFHFELNHWVALTLIGICCIITGSMIEAHYQRIKSWISNKNQYFLAW